MTHEELTKVIAHEVCGKPLHLTCNQCHLSIGSNRALCSEHDKCRIEEKSQEQLSYILSSSSQNIILRSCPGCGKTEVVGLKAAYEMGNWCNTGGIGVLTFTKNASEVIRQRVSQFSGIDKTRYPHFIGTIDSWLHSYIAHPFGHLVTGYQGKAGDNSIRLVDSSSSANFLFGFRTRYSFNKTGNIHANHFFFDLKDNRYVFNSGQGGTNLDTARNSIQLEDWQIKDLDLTKKLFWKGGFATYQDIEVICYMCLSRYPEFAHNLSCRFPLILIDECQDLSWIQLKIIEILIKAGTTFHFIGDLNQAIYDFKDVDPQSVNEFAIAQSFEENFLTKNFRSCQPIVDLCQTLVNEKGAIGDSTILLDLPRICKVYDKDKLFELSIWFEQYLSEHCIDIDNSVILARGWSTVSRLRPCGKEVKGYQQHLALALYLWQKGDIQSVNDALRHVGLFVCDRFFQHSSSNPLEYYCPDVITSKMVWRIFLSEVLDSCSTSQNGISDLNQAWSPWVSAVRSGLGAILRACSGSLDDVSTCESVNFVDLNGTTFQVPRNCGAKPILSMLPTGNVQTSRLRATTIHSVKGETFDAVLLVSARDKVGTCDGHWTQWLEDPTSEAARLAYVASSRPRHLLAWAVPAPSEDQIKLLGDLGFSIIR